MVKKIFILLLFFVSFFCKTTNAGLMVPNSSTGNTIEKKITTTAIAKIKISDFEKLTGKKLTLRQKLAFKIIQIKLKKEIRGAAKDKTAKRSIAALILGILSLVSVILIPLSIVLAVISIILASKSLKENDQDKNAKLAMTFSILTLGIIVVGLLAYGIFFSDGPFKIFIIN